jgi:conjugative transposon TraM protein
MSTEQHSPGFLRKRKMMIVLPVLVLPFITLAFWALGGGKASGATIKQAKNDNRLNLQLPGASLKSDKGLDKMSYYEIAMADSEKLKARMRNDPYFKLKTNLNAETPDDKNNIAGNDADDSLIDSSKGLNASPYNTKINTTAAETKVYDKLKQINAALDNATVWSKKAAAEKTNENRYGIPISSNEPAIDKQHADRLEKMTQTMKQENGGGDSEMIQINEMLEKVMDIQHPERLNEKLKQYSISQKQKVFAVTQKDYSGNDFYKEDNSTGLENADTTLPLQNAIGAVVHETQTLVNGATIKLRLLTEVYINGILIPKDNFVFGKVSLTGERLTISIGSIRYHNSLLPVAMSVYDMDGMDGIYIPGAITRDVAKQSTDNALQSVVLNAVDPSIGAQAAGAGIETAKTMISKKIKLLRVTVKAGYHVLLKDNNNK